MSQNIYDQKDFYEKYSQLKRQVEGFRGAPEWESVECLLPDLSGKRVLDLGCGFGWFCRYAVDHGASSVLGIDLSQNMIAKAQSFPSDDAISYQIADLENLELPENSFDLAYSSLTLHYIKDFTRLSSLIFQALTHTSRFIFTIEHPIFMAPSHPEWIFDKDGLHIWPLNHYSIEGERITDWLTKGIVKQHRTIATTLNTLIGSGFSIAHIEEWKPSEKQIEADPELSVELDRPSFLIVVAEKR